MQREPNRLFVFGKWTLPFVLAGMGFYVVEPRLHSEVKPAPVAPKPKPVPVHAVKKLKSSLSLAAPIERNRSSPDDTSTDGKLVHSGSGPTLTVVASKPEPVKPAEVRKPRRRRRKVIEEKPVEDTTDTPKVEDSTDSPKKRHVRSSDDATVDQPKPKPKSKRRRKHKDSNDEGSGGGADAPPGVEARPIPL